MNKHKHLLIGDIEKEKITPWWVTGFIDAEGCFLISFYKHNDYKLGIKVVPRLLISQHVENRLLLEKLKKYFDGGRIYKKGEKNLGFELEGYSIISSKVKSYPPF